jgi:hypothetical protein
MVKIDDEDDYDEDEEEEEKDKDEDDDEDDEEDAKDERDEKDEKEEGWSSRAERPPLWILVMGFPAANLTQDERVPQPKTAIGTAPKCRHRQENPAHRGDRAVAVAGPTPGNCSPLSPE